MRKIKQLSLMGLLGFSLAQASKASGIQQGPSSGLSTNDTSITKDQQGLNGLNVNEPKNGLNALLSSASIGDDLNTAKFNPKGAVYIENFIARNRKSFLDMKDRAKPYFDLIDEILTQYGVPKELKYLAMIESGLKFNAVSRAGATGPWAFMPATAKQYGLTVSRYKDERLDYIKSTHAAAKMLTDLYQEYGDWLLVIAAYNCGPGNLNKAIRKSGSSTDFWTIQYNLPVESMNHVKKFIGTHYIFEGEGGITTVTKKEMQDLLAQSGPNLNDDEMNSSTTYHISGRFNSSVIIRKVEIGKILFDRYNPGFDNKISLEGKYELRLPTPNMNIFIAKRYEILDESLQLLLNPSNSGTN